MCRYKSKFGLNCFCLFFQESKWHSLKKKRPGLESNSNEGLLHTLKHHQTGDSISDVTWGHYEEITFLVAGRRDLTSNECSIDCSFLKFHSMHQCEQYFCLKNFHLNKYVLLHTSCSQLCFSHTVCGRKIWNNLFKVFFLSDRSKFFQKKQLILIFIIISVIQAHIKTKIQPNICKQEK